MTEFDYIVFLKSGTGDEVEGTIHRCELAGAYVADIVVAGKVILELKSVSIGYLINFHNERVV